MSRDIPEMRCSTVRVSLVPGIDQATLEAFANFQVDACASLLVSSGQGSGEIQRDHSHRWLGPNGTVMVESIHETSPKIEIGNRVCITSAAAPADKLAAVIRQHWAIENSLHLGIDMVFRDDGCRISSGCAPSNFTTE